MRYACLAALLSRAVAGAGLCSEAASEPRHEFQLLAGFSPASPTWIGTAPDRRMVLAGLGYSYRCREMDSVSVAYKAAVFPAAILLHPEETARGAVYGFAMAPVGFSVEFGRKRRVRPFAETLGGVIASTEPVPDYRPNASGLNFLVDVGGGLRWAIGRTRAVTLGYRFVHISNAGTTSFNPGVDNNVIYVGYSFMR